VSYEPENATLIHRFSFGDEDRTDLRALDIPSASLEIEALAPALAAADDETQILRSA